MREPEHEPIESMLGPEKHRSEQLADRREALELWRSRTWKTVYSIRPVVPFGILAVMPDVIVTAFATYGHWRTISDVTQSEGNKQARLWWGLEEHGVEVFEVLQAVDLRHRQAKKRKADEELARKQAALAKKEEEAAERERERQDEQRKKEADAAEKRRKKEEADAKKRAEQEVKRRVAAHKKAEDEAIRVDKQKIREENRVKAALKKAGIAERREKREEAAEHRAREVAEKEKHAAQIAAQVSTYTRARTFHCSDLTIIVQYPAQPVAGPSRSNSGHYARDVNSSAATQPQPGSAPYPRPRMVRRAAQQATTVSPAPSNPPGSLAARPLVTPRPIVQPRSRAAQSRAHAAHPVAPSALPFIQGPFAQDPFFQGPEQLLFGLPTPAHTVYNTPLPIQQALPPPVVSTRIYAQQPPLIYPTPSHTTFNTPAQRERALWTPTGSDIVRSHHRPPFAIPRAPLPTPASSETHTPLYTPSPRLPLPPLQFVLPHDYLLYSQHESRHDGLHQRHRNPYPASPTPAPRITIAIHRTVPQNSNLDHTMFFSPHQPSYM